MSFFLNKILIALLILCFLGCDSSTQSTQSTQDSTPLSSLYPPQSPLIALTPREYNQTIRDLFAFPSRGEDWPNPHPRAQSIAPQRPVQFSVFGQLIDTQPWPWRFPKEIGVHEFEGMAEGQVPSPYLIEQFHQAANHFAAYSLVSPIFFTCQKWEELEEEAQRDCAWSSLVRFAQRAWRRPITAEEQSRLEAFWHSLNTEHLLEERIALTVASLLQAPAFLYRLESHILDSVQSRIEELSSTDLYQELSSWEMASRLSYFLWDSMPDAELFAAAAEGRLSTSQDIEAQARRMLDHPRARSAVVHFHRQWLGVEKVLHITPARRAHASLFGLEPHLSQQNDCDLEWPGIIGPIRASMEAETDLFIERTLFDGEGSFTALMTDHHGYMSDQTAFIYGEDAIPLRGPQVQRSYFNIVGSGAAKNQITLYPTEFPSTQRAGVLTQPSVLAVHAYAVHPAPILRGKHLLERFACFSLGAPPPGAEGQVPPDVDEAEGTNRQRTEAITSPNECTGCHQFLNPPGFAFENYDAFGRWREDDHGLPIQADGSFVLQNGEEFTFNNGVDLAYQLAQSPQVRHCYVHQWVNYAVGYHVPANHQALIDLQAHFQDQDHVKELLVRITQSALFRFIKKETP